MCDMNNIHFNLSENGCISIKNFHFCLLAPNVPIHFQAFTFKISMISDNLKVKYLNYVLSELHT